MFNFGAKHGRPRCICSIDELLREEVFVCVGTKQERESFFSQDIGRGRNPRDWNDVCTRDEVCIMDLD